MDLLEALRRDFPELDALPADCLITGGALRDVLIGRRPLDLDLSCPDMERTADAFARHVGSRRITLGTRFRTERVVVHGAIYDFSPIQGDSIEADLGRRDFTINALGLSLDGVLIDPTDGLKDLEEKVVRMIREDNLVDDPLRILRAPRFTASFDFELDPETTEAASRYRSTLVEVAPERVTAELRMILGAPFGPRGGEDMRAIGIDEPLFGFGLTPEDLLPWGRLLSELEEPQERVVSTLTMLLTRRPDLSRPSILDRWLWTRVEQRSIRDALTTLQSSQHEPDRLRLAAAETGREATARAARVSRALQLDETAGQLEAVLRSDPSPFEIEAILDGHEIAQATGARGEAIGTLKRDLWEEQVLGRISTRDQALDFVRRRSRH